MSDAEKKQRAKIITLMFTCFGNGGDAERTVAYVNLLEDIPVDVLEKICNKAIRECRQLPTIAELIETGRSLVGEMSGNRVKSWAEAQHEIQLGITRTWFYGCLGEDVPDELYGKSCEPHWSTPEIKMAVDSYGFDNLGKVMESDMPIVWAQLRRAYEQACQRKQEREINEYVLNDSNDIKLLAESVTKRIGGM